MQYTRVEAMADYAIPARRDGQRLALAGGDDAADPAQRIRRRGVHLVQFGVAVRRVVVERDVGAGTPAAATKATAWATVLWPQPIVVLVLGVRVLRVVDEQIGVRGEVEARRPLGWPGKSRTPSAGSWSDR